MKSVSLKNGSSEAHALVCVVVMSLERLFTSEPVAFYELVCLARDPAHELWSPQVRRTLESVSLLQGGKMHGSVRNVVLSAVVGDDLDMRLWSPLAEPSREG